MFAESGTVATREFELLSATVKPPEGAAPLIVIVPILELPPSTADGFSVTESTVGGYTPKVAVRISPPAEAVMMTYVLVLTGVVFMVNGALVAPPGTTTKSGVLATPVFELANDTVRPPVSAGLEMVTVPIDGDPPLTFAGFSATEVTVQGCTVRTAVRVDPPADAEIVTAVVELTGVVVTVNCALADLSGTVAIPGTVATPVSLLVSVTSTPPAPASAPSDTVPVAG